MRTTNALLLFSISFGHLAYADQKIIVSDFESKSLSNWSTKVFANATNYSIENIDNIATLKAVSHSSASGIVKKQRIDLKQTPYLNWSWRIDNRLTGLEETSKEGDDYAARIYVVKDGDWKIWSARVVNYVWSSNQNVGSEWNNAFASDNAKMIAIQGKNSELNTWYIEKRDVYADLISQFGDKGSMKKNEKAYRYIDVIALMTDTDNSKLGATAYYRNIYFSAN